MHWTPSNVGILLTALALMGLGLGLFGDAGAWWLRLAETGMGFLFLMSLRGREGG